MADQYDVIVIGSGPGGGTCAYALARRGVKVLMLESGPAYDPDRDFHLDDNEWEFERFPEKIPTKSRQTYAPLQKLSDEWADLRSRNAKGLLVQGEDRFADGYKHVVGLGGSTLHYTGEAHRLHPRAMTMWSRFGVAADWPVSYAELEPYYQQAEELTGVAGPEKNGARWRKKPYPLPAHKLSYGSQVLGKGFEALGYSWGPNARAALSQPYDNRPECNYCGNCARGCPRRDRGSMDNTVIPKLMDDPNCTIVTGAHVIRLDANGNDRVRSAVYVDGKGEMQSVSARAFVVSCGAVETPRLLLNSANRYAKTGLANESGTVGHNFMETVFNMSVGLHPEPLHSYRGLPADAICWDFNAPNAIRDVLGGCRFSSGIAEADLLGPLSYAHRLADGWGQTFKDRVRETFGHALAVTSISEFLPNQYSYVGLDPDEKDEHGLPKARIQSAVSDNDLRRLRFMRKTSQEVLAAAGVGEIVEEYSSYDVFAATHVFGTCRMGQRDDRNVVDADCRSHRWRNLYVVDASVFPSTGGGESPALTIQALALRAGEKMAEQARRGEL